MMVLRSNLETQQEVFQAEFQATSTDHGRTPISATTTATPGDISIVSQKMAGSHPLYPVLFPYESRSHINSIVALFLNKIEF